VRFPVANDAGPTSAGVDGITSPSSQPIAPPVNGTADGGQKTTQADQQWETKILIAAGAIGLVVIIAVAIFMYWRVRKKNKKNQVDGNYNGRNKPEPSNEEPKLNNQSAHNPRAPLGRPWSIGPLNPRGPIRDKEWDNSSIGSLLNKPVPAFSRGGLASSPSLLGAQPSRSPFPPPNPMPSSSRLAERNMFYLETLENHGQFASSISQTRRASIASSSPVLPIEGPGLASNPPSASGSDRRQRRRSSTPSIVEISSTLAPGESVQRRNDNEEYKPSRFSWTNSQAPKTPMDPSSRFSIATSTSSAPRFRTVDSWVGNQTHRLDETRFQDYLEREIEDKISVAVSNGSPPLPSNAESPKKGSPPDSNEYELPKQSNSSPETASSGRRLHSESREYGKRRKKSGRESRLSVPQARDSSAFMVHPGTKVRSPRVSLIPSEILDSRLGHDDPPWKS
jgi:hypothetical protein